LYFLLTGSGAI